MITGYRFGKDKYGEYWLVKLSTTKEEIARHKAPGFENEYVSNDCICETITSLETGEEAKEKTLGGVLGRPINYAVGQKIRGGLVWYCHLPEDLFVNYLHRSKNGKIYKPFLLARKMDFMITEVYGRTYEELADYMHTTPAKLRENVDALRDGLGEREDEALYMPMLIALQRLGKRK